MHRDSKHIDKCLSRWRVANLHLVTEFVIEVFMGRTNFGAPHYGLQDVSSQATATMECCPKAVIGA